MASIVSINISPKKGTTKKPVASAKLIVEMGIDQDAHAHSGERQVSLLSIEDVQRANLQPGDFAENLTFEGIDLLNTPIGTRLQIGNKAVIEITKIGKECHTRCAIYKKIGDCIMPTQGVFARVVVGGMISVGDEIVIL